MRLSSLPLQLMFFVVLPLLALLMLVAFGGVALHQGEMRQMLVNHNRESVIGAAEHLSQQLAQRQEVLDAVATGDDNTLPERLAGLTPLFDGGLAAFAEGVPVASTTSRVDWNALVAQLPSGDEDFRPLIGPGGSIRQLVVTSPDTEESTLRIVGLVSLEALMTSGIMEALHASSSTQLYLLGTDGNVFYATEAGLISQQVATLAERAIQGGTTQTLEGQDTEGYDVVLTVASIPVAGWTLVHEERWKETLSPQMRYSQAAPLALVPAVLLAVAALWFGIRRIVVPLRRLEAQAAELSWGDYQAVRTEVGGIEEIQRLQATLRLMASRLEAAQSSMHHFIGAITQAQEEERRRLARELHDQTAQALVAVDHRQQMLKPYLKDDPAASALLSEVRAMIAATIDGLRRTVRALRPVYLEDLGLVPSLQMLARDLATDSGIATHFEKQGEPVRLPPEHEMALYRIAQEALNNALRHSGAKNVWLTIKFAETQVAVTVRDDGQGFRPPRHASGLAESYPKHFGLMGMYERSALIGAALELHSELGAGTRVTVRVPVAVQESSQQPEVT